MFEIRIKINPEEELFRNFEYTNEIKNYCTGEKGLIFYSLAKFQGDEKQQIEYNEKIQNRLLEEINIPKAKILSFICDCKNNPPSKVRKLIKKRGGIIIDPVLIKQNKELLSIILDSEKDIYSLLQELNEITEVEIQSIQKIDEKDQSLQRNYIREIMTKMTKKQKETLIRAWKKGYYSIPRTITTEKLASDEGITRYAIEKKLRKAENSLIENFIPILMLYDK